MGQAEGLGRSSSRAVSMCSPFNSEEWLGGPSLDRNYHSGKSHDRGGSNTQHGPDPAAIWGLALLCS